MILLAGLLLAGSFTMMSGQSRARYKVAGLVVERGLGEPVVMASVVIKELGLWAVTDADGHFEIAGVPAGRHELEFALLGYETLKLPVEVKGDLLNLGVELAISSLSLDAVVVTAKEGGEITTASKITKQTLEHIQPSSLSVLVTGNYDDALLDILRSGQEVTVDDSTPISSIYEQKPVQTSTERHISIDSHLPRVQAAVYLGCLLPPPSDPDMPLLRLASTLLGGYFGSRLMSNIRERRGLTYGINSTIFNIPYDNALVIACETSTQHAEEVVSEVKRELQRLCDDLVGDDELQMVKNYMEGKSCRRNERSFNYPQVLMNLIATGRTPDDLVANRRRQQAATPADIQRIARQYLSPERFVSCIVC